MANRSKVLIIEDNPKDAELLVALLGIKIYDIVVVPSTVDYVAEIAQELPDLILLNACLPDSRAICQTLKASANTDMVPVVFVNGDDLREEVESAFNAGAEEYLDRWVGQRMLAKTVETLLSFDQVLRQAEYDQVRRA